MMLELDPLLIVLRDVLFDDCVPQLVCRVIDGRDHDFVVADRQRHIRFGGSFRHRGFGCRSASPNKDDSKAQRRTCPETNPDLPSLASKPIDHLRLLQVNWDHAFGKHVRGWKNEGGSSSLHTRLPRLVCPISNSLPSFPAKPSPASEVCPRPYEGENS